MSNAWSKVKRLFWIPAEDELVKPINSSQPVDELRQIMRSLDDLEGVRGWLIIDQSGRVRSHELPSMFGTEAVQSLGDSVRELAQAVDPTPASSAAVVVDYEGYSFHLKVSSGVTVSVLAEAASRRPALSMALNLITRRVVQQLCN